jgi:membrane associated rhomboid family serine protease
VSTAEPPRRAQKGGPTALPFVFCRAHDGLAAAALLVLAAASLYLGTVQVRPVTQKSEPDYSEPNAAEPKVSEPEVWEPEVWEPKVREPMFNVPPVVLATVAVLVLVHVLRVYVLTDDQDLRFLLDFAFIPARYSTDLAVSGALPGGFGAELWTFFTYAFIHADIMHLGLNLAWLVPFGTALARRFGALRYTAFMLVLAAVGALAHLVTHFGAMEPMIGASAAISGAMAAAMRFVFQRGGPLALLRGGAVDAYRVPAAPLAATLRDSRFLLFVAVWLGLNLLFGLGTVSFGEEAGQPIAWQAHIGGFFAGLLLFDAFDPIVPHAEPENEPSN